MTMVSSNFDKRNALAPEFKRIFGMNLMHYWDTYCGFDIIKFDEHVGTPDGISCKDHVLEKWGQVGVDLLLKLMEPIKE